MGTRLIAEVALDDPMALRGTRTPSGEPFRPATRSRPYKPNAFASLNSITPEPETPHVHLWRRRVIARPDDGQLSATYETKVHMDPLLRTTPLTLQDVFDYLDNELIGFETDPADTQFLQGYEQALIDMEYHLIGRRPEDTLH